MDGITGRDSFIVARALYWFVRTQQALPLREQSVSDTRDAIAILNAIYPTHATADVQADEFVGRTPAVLNEDWEPA